MSLSLHRVVVLGVILALLGGGCGSAARLGAKGLSKQAQSLRSAAAEGALLADDAASGRTTRVFAREHSADLYEAAAGVEASLRTAKTGPGLQPRLRRLRELAARVSADLERLGGASGAEERSIGRRLEAGARESENIGQAAG